MHADEKIKAERIATPADGQGATTTADKNANVEKVFKETRKELKLFISLIAKTVSLNHYATIINNCTTLQWIYDKIREDYHIQMRGIHFLNILDLSCDEAIMKPMGFYNHYRSVVMNNLGKT